MRNETTNSAAQIVRGYLLENIDIPDLKSDVDIFAEGYVNSLFAIELMTFLEKTFQIKVVMEDLDMENFKSIDTICEFIKKKKEGDTHA